MTDDRADRSARLVPTNAEAASRHARPRQFTLAGLFKFLTAAAHLLAIPGGVWVVFVALGLPLIGAAVVVGLAALQLPIYWLVGARRE